MKKADSSDRSRSKGSFGLHLALDVLLAAFFLAMFYFFLRILPQ